MHSSGMTEDEYVLNYKGDGYMGHVFLDNLTSMTYKNEKEFVLRTSIVSEWYLLIQK